MNQSTSEEIDIFETNDSPYAVQVRGLFYAHDRLTKKRYVLNGLDINVLKGQIYALLGPSGCGKSTLLKCLTGIIVPDLGNITISAQSKIPGPGVGYMPQELALLDDLTTTETLTLFGKLNGVPAKILEENIKRFSEMFDLAPGYRFIANLSEGQKRRVSLVCTLLHEPPLLIMDEPTVGLDPLLRKVIWDYILDLTKTKKTTIILTTHFIEEAKDAHTIGLMREGKLLVENSPLELLNHFKEKSLERCFYQICENNELKNDESSKLLQSLETVNPKTKNEDQHSPYLKVMDSTKLSHLKDTKLPTQITCTTYTLFCFKYIISSLVVKNVNLLKRNIFLLTFQFCLPSFVIFFCGICFGTKITNIPIGVFNGESPPDLSQSFIRHVANNPFQQTFFNDLNSSVDFVKSGKSKMTIHIPQDFSTCYRNRLELGIHASKEDLKCSFVYIFFDATNIITFLELRNMVMNSFEFFQKEYIRNYTVATPQISLIPMSFDEPVYGDKKSSFTEYMMPALLPLLSYFLAAVLAGYNLLIEKENGITERISVCGVTKSHLFLGQFLTSVVIVFVQVFLMLATLLVLFETSVKGSYFLVVTLVVLQGICGMLFAFLLTAIANSVLAAFFSAIGIYFATIIMCGFLWPLEGMPIALRWIARFIPVTQTVEGLRSVMLRGWGLEHFQVQMGLLSILSWSAFFLVASLLIFRAQK